MRAGLSKAGVPEEILTKGAAIASRVPYIKAFTGPDAGQVQSQIEKYTGEFYKPQTVPGQYASTLAEFAPGAAFGGGGVVPRVVNTVVPALTSETLGQYFKGTSAEPWARGIGGVGSALLTGKAITPIGAAPAAHQRNIAILEREGIPVSAGQHTGNKALQWAESNAADMPGANRARQMQAEQAGAFDRAVTERMFDPAQLTARGVPAGIHLPDPRAFNAGRQSLSDEYNRLSRANQLRSDPQLQRELTAAQTNYERNVLPSQRTRDVEAVRNDITDRLVQGQGRLPGDEYQAIRSQLGTNARGAAVTQPYLATALRDTRAALDRAMMRGLSPADAAAWQLNNRRYANMKQVGEPAAAAAGENLSPLKVAQTARSGRNAEYAGQQGDMDELAKAAATVMKPLPNSGTAARTGMQQLFNMLPNALAGSAGGAAAGSMFGPVGAIGGAALPFIMPKLITSRLGQAYLGNQAMPQNVRDIIAQTVAQQAISQPEGIARNQVRA